MTLIALFAAALFVAYSNGANDNFKGVATLFGSDTASYRTALLLATIATFAGSLSSVIVAQALIKAFSGHGLVPDAIASSPEFLLAVAFGAGATVIAASILGFPVSTTHGLTGALVGAGLVAAGGSLNMRALGATFFAPLVVSPVIAVVVTVPLYKMLHGLRSRFGIARETCLCIGAGEPAAMTDSGIVTLAVAPPRQLVAVGDAPGCIDSYPGQAFGISLQRLVDSCHHLSAGAVSFARGLNDTPKIVALLFVVQALDLRFGVIAIAFAMAIGGLLNARKVACTMSKKIARMNEGQAFTANIVTALLVIFASRLGLPVSTTHVSVGAITGVGIINGSANASMLTSILLSWVLILPMAALIGAISYFALRILGA